MSTYAQTIRDLQGQARTAFNASAAQHPVFYGPDAGVTVPVGGWHTVGTTVARPTGAEAGVRLHITGAGGTVTARLIAAPPDLTGVAVPAAAGGLLEPTLDISELDPAVYVTFTVQAGIVAGAASRVAVVETWLR